MCRCGYTHDGGLLNIQAFFVRLRLSDSGFNGKPAHHLPQFLSLLFHPPNLPLSLHRLAVHRHPQPQPHAIFGAKLTQSLRATQGLGFQLYLGEAKLLKGLLVGEDDRHWRLECRSQLQSHSQNHQISEVQVCVALDHRNVAVSQWVKAADTVAVKAKENINPWIHANGSELERIPEEMEFHGYEYDDNGHGSDSDEYSEEPDPEELVDFDLQLERLGRAVDKGIWAVWLGLGVGFLVSKASARKFRLQSSFFNFVR